MSSQSAPECTLQSLSYNTDTASSILLTLDCSDNICGCHLLHSLCNHPFNKPLHPPGLRPSPFLSILWRRKGDQSNHIYVVSEPPQSERTLAQIPLYDLRFASVDKGSDAKREQDPLSLPCGWQLPLYNFVGKGSDAYQTIYRNTNEHSVYIG